MLRVIQAIEIFADLPITFSTLVSYFKYVFQGFDASQFLMNLQLKCVTFVSFQGLCKKWGLKEERGGLSPAKLGQLGQTVPEEISKWNQKKTLI